MAELSPDDFARMILEPSQPSPDGKVTFTLHTGSKVPDGWYVKISFGHGVSGVLVDEQAGEIRIPFMGKDSCLRAIAGLSLSVEHRGTMVPGEVVRGELES